jgi:hypothetical protein
VAPRTGEPPVGLGNTPRFGLFAMPGDAASRLLRDYPDLLEPALRPPLAHGGILLVRPDGYVAAAARVPDLARIAGYLEGLRGAPRSEGPR